MLNVSVPESDSGGEKVGLQHLETEQVESSLKYLNQHHSYPSEFLPAQEHRPLLRLLGRVRRFILGDYLSREQEYLGYLVRYLNELGLEVSRLTQARQEFDSASHYSLERKVVSRVDAICGDFRRDLTVLQRDSSLSAERLATIESVTKGLERILGGLGRDSHGAESGAVSPESAGTDASNNTTSQIITGKDAAYLLFENRFRGSESAIRERNQWYSEQFLHRLRASNLLDSPVLELGPGRGEMLKSFSASGVKAYGVEIDPAMVKRCQENGLDVRCADILEHLESLPDRTLGGFVAVQVIEHLPTQLLHDLLLLLSKKLLPGGHVALETVNTASLVALAHNYTRDVTHVPPRHPDTVEFLVGLAGLKVLERRELSPYPSGAMLQLYPQESWYPPQMASLVNLVNQNAEQLNRLLFGYQDYCILAEAV